MTAVGDVHRAELHRSCVGGIEAIALTSNRHFPRHAHDQFGIGVLHFTAQRVNRRYELTPPNSIISVSYRADRRRDPTPNDTHGGARAVSWPH